MASVRNSGKEHVESRKLVPWRTVKKLGRSALRSTVLGICANHGMELEAGSDRLQMILAKKLE